MGQGPRGLRLWPVRPLLEGSELCCNVRVAGSQGMWALKKVGPACILERGPVWGKDLEG